MIRNIKFERFAAATLEVGATNQQERPQYTADINGIQCELKRKTLTIGFGSSVTVREQLFNALVDSPFTLCDTQPNGYINLEYSTDDDVTEFCNLLTFINELDIQRTSSGRRTYTGVNKLGLFTNIAKVIKAASDVKMYSMINRDVFGSGIYDIIAINEKNETNNYGEHLVPCVMIIDEAFRMFEEDNASVNEVAHMIKCNLVVMFIPTEVANKMDYELGLKTTMPEGWQFGDSVFARLHAAEYSF